MSDIAMIGERDSVLLARAGGMDAYAADTPEYAAKLIKKLANEGTRVIFVTERMFEKVRDTAAHYKTSPFPAIIPVPDSHGATGAAMAELRANVEKAIGVDILFSEDK